VTHSDSPIVAPTPGPSAEDEPLVRFPDNPVLAVVTRGEALESFHRGAAIVLDADGTVRLAFGDVERPVFARSALKPLQALPLLEAGAGSPLLTDARVALHTASHAGWPDHTTRIAAWLTDLGLSAEDLACGAADGSSDWPLDPAAARALAADGCRPTRLHHNCSGQHAGFLMLAGLMGAPTAGYDHADHPVQRAVTTALREMTDVDPDRLPRGVEGCGIPSPALPLWAVALGMARLADPTALTPKRADAAVRLRRAMATHPALVSGPGRCDTRLADATDGRVLTKIGAEGNLVALLPEAGLGLALKMDDGGARGAELALGAILDSLGILTESERDALADLLQPTLVNAAGHPVGHGLPVWPDEDTDSEMPDERDPWDWDEIDPA